MPSSIPYDPSLVLAGLVQQNVNDTASATAQTPTDDAAQDQLNAVMRSKRASEMTRNELQSLGIGTTSLDAEIQAINTSINGAAEGYVNEKVQAEGAIAEFRKADLDIKRLVGGTRSQNGDAR